MSSLVLGRLFLAEACRMLRARNQVAGFIERDRRLLSAGQVIALPAALHPTAQSCSALLAVAAAARHAWLS